MDVCPICSTQFKRHYRRAGKRQVFCSKSCRFKGTWTERECPTCHKMYRVNKFHLKQRPFCSVACTQRSPCLRCGTIILGRKTFQSGEKRFCSRKCAAFVNQTMRHDKYAIRGFAITIKRLGGVQCEQCGEKRLGALCVHHKDRNRKNNNFENLITLCGTCHYLVHWKNSAQKLKHVELAYRIAEHI